MFIRDVIMNFLNYFCSLGIDMFHVDISTISTNTAGEEDNSGRRLVNADKAVLATHKSAGMKEQISQAHHTLDLIVRKTAKVVT